MNPTTNHADQRWAVLADGYYQDFDELAQSVSAWSVDFRQLSPGRSPADLIQFGSRDFLVSRFHMSKPCDQHGSTPPGMLTLGIIEDSAGNVMTPEGALTHREMWCFSAGREFACTSQSDFRAYGLSFSESLLDEVAYVFDLWDIRSILGSNRVVRCQRHANIDEIRHRVARVARGLRRGEAALRDLLKTRELELDVARQLLEALQGPLDVIRPPTSNRRQLVLGRTLDYLEANPTLPVSVHELARVVGAGVRTLEYVFRDYFGVTPKAYLTTRRLIGARRELQRSNNESTLVGDVALHWGFLHLGRFSVGYRQFFGELPSQTLQKM